MKPRQIITAHEPVVCEVCRRTLLRGENPVGFIADGRPVKVCELCEPRAVHEGWVREGVPVDAQSAARRRDRKSILRRLRGDAPAPRRAAPSVMDLSLIHIYRGTRERSRPPEPSVARTALRRDPARRGRGV